MFRLNLSFIKIIKMLFQDKIVLALMAAIIHLFLCLLMAPYEVDHRHDGYMYKPAVDFIHGAMVHRDSFQQYGPLSNIFASLALLLFGEKLIVLRFYVAAIYALISFFLFFVFLEILPLWFAFFSVLIYIFISPHAFVGLEPNPVHDAILLSLIMVLMLSRFLKTGKKKFLFWGGLVTGLIWGVRNTMGMYVFLGILLFLFLEPFLEEKIYITTLIKDIFVKVVLFVFGFFVSVFSIILWLYCNNALSDWYLQTVILPQKMFSLSGALSYFNLWYWIAINRIMQSLWFFPMMGVSGMVAAVKGFQEKNKGLLLVSIFSVFCWPNAMPNGCPAHQWWAMTVGVGLFVYMLWEFAGKGKTIIGNICVVLVVIFAVSGYVRDSFSILVNKISREIYDIEKPILLKGMKTDRENIKWITGLGSVLEEIRRKFPTIKLVSFGNYIQIPLVLCYIDHNINFPLWIEWPALDTVYPHYITQRNEYIKREMPLLITDNEANIAEGNPYYLTGYKPYKFGIYVLFVPEKVNDYLSMGH